MLVSQLFSVDLSKQNDEDAGNMTLFDCAIASSSKENFNHFITEKEAVFLQRLSSKSD